MNIRYPIYEGVYRILTDERGDKKAGFLDKVCNGLAYSLYLVSERGKAGVLRYTACVRNGHGKRHGTFGIVAEKPADRANDNEYL